jgi:hypothetical protein
MNQSDVINFIKHETQLLDESVGEFISKCEELICGTWDVTFEEQLTIWIELAGYNGRSEANYYMV